MLFGRAGKRVVVYIDQIEKLVLVDEVLDKYHHGLLHSLLSSSRARAE